jgi:hypothetical protein
MRALAIIAVAGVAIVLPCPRSSADLMLLTIRAPRQCPDGLTIKSKAGDGGLLEYDVAVDAEEVAHAGALYRGRVRSLAILKLKVSGQEAASVSVSPVNVGRRTHYYFSLAPSAARTSELQLSVSLFEKDGFATIGGGVSMQVQLSGFEPAEKPSK